MAPGMLVLSLSYIFSIIIVSQEIMFKLHCDPNAKRGTHTDQLFEKLSALNSTLEGIQRSLSLYLETKRQYFPRFYFLSNDDLMEILGQSKNPEAVSHHCRHCKCPSGC